MSSSFTRAFAAMRPARSPKRPNDSKVEPNESGSKSVWMAPIYAFISYQESVPREKGNTAKNFYLNSAIELNFMTA